MEFCAVLTGLTVFTGASIAEIVGAASCSASGAMGGLPWPGLMKGQASTDRASGAAGDPAGAGPSVPQPGQHAGDRRDVDLTVSDTTITQTGRAIEGFLLLLFSFLLLNLLISGGMAVINTAVLGRLRRSR